MKRNEFKEKTNRWQKTVYQWEDAAPGRFALQQLQDGECAVLVIKNLLTNEELDAMKHRIEAHRELMRVTNYTNGSLTTIGPFLAKQLNAPEQYFENAATTDILFPNPAHDIRVKLRESLRKFFGVRNLEVLRERNGRAYAPAIIRFHADGVSNPLHNDHIRRDARETRLSVANLETQFSCIACIQECDAGGELINYNKTWESSDEKHKIPNGLGYDSAVVSGYSDFIFKPQTGDVYVINPTFYHEINQVKGIERITMGFFFGSFDTEMKDLVAWS